MSMVLGRDTLSFLEEFCAKKIQNPSMHAGVIAWTRQNVPVLPLKSVYDMSLLRHVVLITVVLSEFRFHSGLYIGVTDRTSILTDGRTNRQIDRQTDRTGGQCAY